MMCILKRMYFKLYMNMEYRIFTVQLTLPPPPPFPTRTHPSRQRPK